LSTHAARSLHDDLETYSEWRPPNILPADCQSDVLESAETVIKDGLDVARDCGFGLYHIDLLLERARLRLFKGDPHSAREDIELALDTGIPANDETGQPELLAANDEECDFAWGIVEGRHLRGEALLLQAAQALGSESFKPAERDQLPSEVRELITKAEGCLNDAMARWRDLRDPEPTEDNNFVHPETGVEYNYKATETYQVLADLSEGQVTRYPLEPFADPAPEDNSISQQDVSETNMGFDVFLSHNSVDKPAVRDLKQHLVNYQLAVWYDEDELRPGIPWQQLLEDGIKSSDSVAVVVGKDGIGPWEDEEMQAALRLAVKNKRPVIPVLLPGAPSEPKLPMFLGNRTWVDLREGFTVEGVGKLVWGISGTKPPHKADPSQQAENVRLTNEAGEVTVNQQAEEVSMSSGAVQLWRERLSALLEADALEDDPTRKLRYKKQIEECRQKIQELTANP